jgi:hypothetical protein
VPKHGCSHGFRASVTIKAAALRRVRVTLDGHVVYRKTRKRFGLVVDGGRIGHGMHRLRVRARPRKGPVGRHVNHFRICRA